MSRYTVGLDFGTESVRAVVVDVSDGRELGSGVRAYVGGVIDSAHPGAFGSLGPGWALQDPADYLSTLPGVVMDALVESGVAPQRIIGLGLDFTACTLVPVTLGGTPLCLLPKWRDNPHAWVKLWKHHAAQPQADRISDCAAAAGQAWLKIMAAGSPVNGFSPKYYRLSKKLLTLSIRRPPDRSG